MECSEKAAAVLLVMPKSTKRRESSAAASSAVSASAQSTGKKFDTPVDLVAASAEFHREAIEKRGAFADFMEKTGIRSAVLEELKEVIAELGAVARDASDGVVGWIGGSRAWEHWRRTSMSESAYAALSPAEKSALVAGNYDVFFAANDLQTCATVTCEVYGALERMKARAEKILAAGGYPYKLAIGVNGFKARKNLECVMGDPVPAVLFPGYQMSLTLVTDLSNTAVTTRRKEANPHKDAPFAEKLMFYAEVFHLPGIDLGTFAQQYLVRGGAGAGEGVRYLSPLGLVTFSLMISAARTEKGLNVDRYRRDIFMKLLPPPTTTEQAFQIIVDHYEKVFPGDHPLYDGDFTNDLRLETIRSRVPEVAAMTEWFEAWLIERLRPAVNSALVRLGARVESESGNKAFLFVVGGDAMRRYKPAIGTTKDIDTKIYISGGRSVSDKVERVVTEELTRLVYYLFTNKQQLFGQGENNSIFLNPELTGGKDAGVKASIQFMSPDPNSLQFRVRQIERSEHFPVTLFSVDFRSYLLGSERGRDFKIKYDIPVLDVVLQGNVNDSPKGRVVEIHDGIPVASLEFLLKDLITTYHQKEMAAMREWGEKRGKDLARFRKLKKMWIKRLSSNVPAIPNWDVSMRKPEKEEAKVALGAKDVNYMFFAQAAADTTKWYLDEFKTVRTRNRKRKIIKHKMPFDFARLARRVDELQALSRRVIGAVAPPREVDRMSTDDKYPGAVRPASPIKRPKEVVADNEAEVDRMSTGDKYPPPMRRRRLQGGSG